MRIGTFRADLAARLAVGWTRGKRNGILRSVIEGVVSLALALLLSPLALVMHLAGFRRLTFVTTRIGHLAAEPDCFLKARALGELSSKRWFFIAQPGWVANEHLLSYWERLIPVVRNPIACKFVARMTAFGLMRYDTGRYVLWYDRSQDIYRLNAKWRGRPPLQTLTHEDEAWGQVALRELGIPPDGWFVCVHAREGGFAPDEEVLHRYRNADPEALIPAMQEIVARGGRCVRMGDETMLPLPSLPGIIDYAHHPLRSARLDVVLCAKTQFFLGNSSGLGFVASVFGRPSLLVNAVPMAGLAPWPTDLSVPKLYWDRHNRRLLRFNEILGTPAASYRFAAQYEGAGIELRENTPDEILAATIEMLDQLEEGRSLDPSDERLIESFMSLLKPMDYGYGAVSRVSPSFLRKHQDLLPGESDEAVPRAQ